jgi:hypothetical protein
VSEDEKPARPLRRPGRPRQLDGPGVPVGAWMTDREYDRLIQTAKQHEVSVSQLIRRLVFRRLP